MNRFDDKVAIVTGAAGGIGEAYARRAGGRGGRSVVIADVDEEGRARRSPPRSPRPPAGTRRVRAGRHLDVPSTLAMAEATVDRFGGIDLLVNNAAIYGDMEFDLLLTVDWDYYRGSWT
jgi:3-oxoacyl-[acyl-carrier protein] reductase